MSIFLLRAHRHTSCRCFPALSHHSLSASPLPPTPPSFFPSKPSYLGTRLLHTQWSSLCQDPSVLPPFDAKCPLRQLPFHYPLASLYNRLTFACPHPRLVSFELVSARSFSSSEAVNVVIASTEECSHEVVETAPVQSSSVPAESDCSSALAAAESSQGESNVSDVQKLEEVVQMSAELQYEGPAEKIGLNESSAVPLKGNEDFGSAVSRLEKMIEVQKQSLDQVRAQLENQQEIISSILKDVNTLKSQSERRIKGEERLKSLSTGEERLVKLESERVSVTTKVESVPRGGDVSLKFQPPFWPEWTSFLERLNGLDLFQLDSQTSPEGRIIFEDPSQIRRAFAKFSRSHGPAFEYDIRNLLYTGRLTSSALFEAHFVIFPLARLAIGFRGRFYFASIKIGKRCLFRELLRTNFGHDCSEVELPLMKFVR